MRRLTATLLAATLVACGGGQRDAADSGRAESSGGVDLTGAGATFPYPLYDKWFSDYAAEKGVRINYQSIGSGGGIRQLQEGTVDFGASDAPMTDEEMTRAKGGPVLHVPTVIGAVAVAYNLTELAQPLKLSGEVLADIFLGRITRWNDTRIAALNAGATLPSRDILVVHRSDGSGTTYVFTDYLSAVSPAWKSGPGRGKDVRWPTGLGGRGNEGVAGQVKQTPGSIGYVEIAYARQNRLATAEIRNRDGNFVAPSVESATEAAAGVAASLPPSTDYRISIVNAPGPRAYPISSFTWLLVYRNQADTTKARKLEDFLKWALVDGQSRAPRLDYAPLPGSMTTRLATRIDSLVPGAAP